MFEADVSLEGVVEFSSNADDPRDTTSSTMTSPGLDVGKGVTLRGGVPLTDAVPEAVVDSEGEREGVCVVLDVPVGDGADDADAAAAVAVPVLTGVAL